MGHPSGVIEQSSASREVNLVLRGLQRDPTFEEDIAKLDINPELTKNQQEDLRNVIRCQHAAFAYGERKLGHTNLAIMKIEAGDADPVS